MDNFTPFEFEHFENPELSDSGLENDSKKITQVPAPENAVDNILNYSRAVNIRKTSNRDLPFVEFVLN